MERAPAVFNIQKVVIYSENVIKTQTEIYIFYHVIRAAAPLSQNSQETVRDVSLGGKVIMFYQGSQREPTLCYVPLREQHRLISVNFNFNLTHIKTRY